MNNVVKRTVRRVQSFAVEFNGTVTQFVYTKGNFLIYGINVGGGVRVCLQPSYNIRETEFKSQAMRLDLIDMFISLYVSCFYQYLAANVLRSRGAVYTGAESGEVNRPITSM